MTGNFELKFDPRTIEHLGVKMYSTLPPALAELISNSYDADASKVVIQFHEKNGTPVSINVMDDGVGMSSSDVQNKFLVIGRNRRATDGDIPSPRFHRLPTGKKGLGKLALFGLAKMITVDSVKEGKRNRFSLSWDDLLNADGTYNPFTEMVDGEGGGKDGTKIKLSVLKRKSPFDLDAIADSLSRMFVVDDEFNIVLRSTDGYEVEVSNERRYARLKKEFEWDVADLVKEREWGGDIYGKLITSETPIPPSSGLRGVTIFSRGKLVNAPEFFSNSTSSHFFQYLTGWISADFIDLLDEDVISTNRQYINWEHHEMMRFRSFLSGLISEVSSRWREKRKEKKEHGLKQKTGIDKAEWFSKLPDGVKAQAQKIVDTLSDDDGISANYSPVIKALHEIIPEYPLLHWRHLHEGVRDRVETYYKNEQYAQAADQGTKIYSEIVRELTGKQVDGTDVASVFGMGKAGKPLLEVADIKTDSGRNIQEGQQHMTRGVMHGFRNPVNHSPIDSIVPGTFTELDCLNILSVISYLVSRLDRATVNIEGKE